MNFGALLEGKVGLGIPHGAPPPLVWGTQIIQEFNEGLVLLVLYHNYLVM